ncbi:HyaD/HybD family hydrogenase maturation endopeptidase [Candidatus Halobeggiatoa sp. HSG11]|nr:HyaD/HybD family hydrogenase maturation endopeptidase [Candidatus Halobeggiatoa sp. HSG11]
MDNLLILGVGNLLLTDEGVGVHAVNSLLKNYHIPAEIEVVDGGTAGMELLTFIAKAKQVIILDAVKTGKAAGTIICLKDKEVPTFFRTKLSPHQVGLSDILAAVKLTGEQPEQVTIFGIEPDSIKLGMELSDKVAAQLDGFVDLIVKEVNGLGFKLVAKNSSD